MQSMKKKKKQTNKKPTMIFEKRPNASAKSIDSC